MPTHADLRTQANLLRTSAAAKLAEVDAGMEREEGETLTTSAAADDWRARLLDWAAEEIEVLDLALKLACRGGWELPSGIADEDLGRDFYLPMARAELAKRNG